MIHLFIRIKSLLLGGAVLAASPEVAPRGGAERDDLRRLRGVGAGERLQLLGLCGAKGTERGDASEPWRGREPQNLCDLD